MKIKEYITKLQNLPDSKKKMILWSVVAVLAIIMGFFWIKGAIYNFSKIGEQLQNIELPKVDTSGMPKIDLQELEKQINQTADWETYTNDKYEFELKYPVGYEAALDESGSSGNPLFYVKNSEKDVRASGDGPYPNYAFMLNVYSSLIGGSDPDIFKTPEEWATNQKKSFIKETVNGFMAYIYDYKLPSGQEMKDNNIFLENGDMYDLYVITYKKDDVGQKILSTFKFVK